MLDPIITEPINQELLTLTANTELYLSQMKQQTLTKISVKLNKYESDILEAFKKEMNYLSQIPAVQDMQDSYIILKNQLKHKIDKFKEIDTFIEELCLNGKFIAIDPLIYLPQFKPNVEFKQLKGFRKKTKLVKKTEFICPVCQKNLNSPYAVRQHLRLTHVITQALFCPHCVYQIGTARQLAQHIFDSHCINKSRDDQYRCFYTGEILNTRQKLQYHIPREKGYLQPYQSLNDSDSHKETINQDKTELDS